MNRETRLWISFLSVLLTVACALYLSLEIIASCFISKHPDYIRRDFRLNHYFKPHSEMKQSGYVRENKDFPKPIVKVFNDRGWASTYDVDPVKPTGTYRIFYIGDLFVEGTCQMDKNVPSTVQRYLNANYNQAGFSFEVVNTGTMSYSPLIYYVLTRYVISRYQPDLIVVCVDMTDVLDDRKYKGTLITDSNGDPWAVPPRDIYRSTFIHYSGGSRPISFTDKIRLFLFENSNIFNMLIQIAGDYNTATEDVEEVYDALGDQEKVRRMFAWCEEDPWTSETEQDVKFSMDMLESLALYCKERGIKLLLTGVPHWNQFAYDSNGGRRWSIRPHQEIERVAQRTGAAYFDSVKHLEVSMKDAPQHRYYYTDDMHLNPRGYALWSEAHIKALTEPEKHLLPEAVYGRKPSDKMKIR